MTEKATCEQDQLYVLALNSGSSSIKFALYQMRPALVRAIWILGWFATWRKPSI